MPSRGKLCASHNCTGISPYSKNPANTEVIATHFENTLSLRKLKTKKIHVVISHLLKAVFLYPTLERKSCLIIYFIYDYFLSPMARCENNAQVKTIITITIWGMFFRLSLVLQMVTGGYTSLTKPYICLDNRIQVLSLSVLLKLLK